MKETERIIKLYNDLYNGVPWIDVSLKGTLKKLSARQAAKKVSRKYNSVWEIVNHIIKWRIHVLKRLEGEKINVTGNNYFEKVTDISEGAWRLTLKQLDDSQKQWNIFLKKLKDRNLENINPKSRKTYYWHIHSIIQHDAYHLGQIVMLTKAIG
jgi:uncharacterized damage-inducible protein DinB